VTFSGTPRIVTLETPSAPSLSIVLTTMTSDTASGVEPFRLIPGAARMSETVGSSITLASSASLPFRRTIAVSARPDADIVFLMPADNIKDEASTNTTSAMPAAVAMVVALRTARLRTL
jgi:hypothetical protein